MSPSDGYISTGDGTRIETMRLVERLRAFRGRLSRRMMCRAMGYPDSNQTIYLAVKRLCVDYQIAAADDRETGEKYVKPEVGREDVLERLHESTPDLVRGARELRIGPSETQRMTGMLAAKAELRRQIQLAVAERDTAPLYKPKDMTW